MSPEAQRIVIAEACGWTRRVNNGAAGGFFYSHKTLGGAHSEWDLPDYPTDLNAMHQAEKVLTAEQSEEYMSQIQAITFKDDGDWGLCHVSAAQRAEAFLRTIGKWKES